MNVLFVFTSNVTFVFWRLCKALYLSKISSNENFVCTSLLKRDELIKNCKNKGRKMKCNRSSPQKKSAD